jgi:hypothetical protein
LLATFDEHPLADDWKDAAYEGLRKHFDNCAGTVYVVTNPVHVNLYKVGQTQRAVDDRITSLNSAGVVGYFIPVADVQVQDRFAVEAAVHRLLKSRDDAQFHKEFFSCTWDVAINALHEQTSIEAEHLAQFNR